MTAYYLWLPFLLTFCFGFAKFPRSIWRNFLENNLVKILLGLRAEPAVITQDFLDFRPMHHLYFGFCEFLNMAMVIVFLFITAGGICEDLTEKECGVAAGIVNNVELEAKANGHNQESCCR